MSVPQYVLYTEIVYVRRVIVQLRFGENLNRPSMDACISNNIIHYMVVLNHLNRRINVNYFIYIHYNLFVCQQFRKYDDTRVVDLVRTTIARFYYFIRYFDVYCDSISLCLQATCLARFEIVKIYILSYYIGHKPTTRFITLHPGVNIL